MTSQLNSHQFRQVYKDLDIDLDECGCVMLDIEPLKNMYSVEFDGAATALYVSKNKKRKWIDGWVVGDTAHITMLYGLMENANKWKKQVKRVLKDWEMKTVKIDHIGHFDSQYKDEDYYVIVAHIEVSDKLQEGHDRLEFLPHINTFAGYKPHMTIAYIRKDKALLDKYLKWMNKLWKGKRLKVKSGINYGYKPE